MYTYELLDTDTVAVRPILRFHFTILMKSVKRKIKGRAMVRHPWKISCQTYLYRSVFNKWYRAVCDHRIQTFNSCSAVKIKEGDIKFYKIVFSHIGPFSYHLGQAVQMTDFLIFQDAQVARWFCRNHFG